MYASAVSKVMGLDEDELADVRGKEDTPMKGMILASMLLAVGAGAGVAAYHYYQSRERAPLPSKAGESLNEGAPWIKDVLMSTNGKRILIVTEDGVYAYDKDSVEPFLKKPKEK
jgi:hypothetical protein